MHGGTLTIDSQENIGTTVTIKIPVVIKNQTSADGSDTNNVSNIALNTERNNANEKR